MFDILSNITPENGFKASSDRWTQLNNKVEHSHFSLLIHILFIGRSVLKIQNCGKRCKGEQKTN